MPYSVWQAFVTDGGETVVQGATVTVYLEASGLPATLYDGPAGAAIANPQTSAVDGLARFYVPAGLYRIDVTKGELTKTFRHIAIGEAASKDVGVANGVAPLDVDSQVPSDHLLSYYTEAEANALLLEKQATLVSGDNIKTVNGGSLLGPGDLTVGLLYHAEFRNAAAPNATTPAQGLLSTGAEAAIDLILSPKGTGALSAHTPDSTAVGGNKRGLYAVDWQRSRAAAAKVASGDSSTIGGGEGNQASGQAATVAGGQSNTASGVRSVIAGGMGNSATVDYAVVGGGQNNTSSGTNAFTAGNGNSNGGQNAATFGTLNVMTASNGAVFGNANEIGGTTNYAFGSQAALTSSRGGWNAMARACGMFGFAGDAQSFDKVIRRETTNATPGFMGSNGTGSDPVHTMAIASYTSVTAQFLVVAHEFATGDTAHFWIKVAALRAAGGAAVLVGAPVIEAIRSAGAAAWNATAVIETFGQGLTIQVTGEAAKTIRWVAHGLAVTHGF